MKISPISRVARVLHSASAKEAKRDRELAEALGMLASILDQSGDTDVSTFVARVRKLRGKE